MSLKKTVGKICIFSDGFQKCIAMEYGMLEFAHLHLFCHIQTKSLPGFCKCPTTGKHFISRNHYYCNGQFNNGNAFVNVCAILRGQCHWDVHCVCVRSHHRAIDPWNDLCQ